MTIQALETRYAGCRFRSRLEARWAVFFDHLGIRWEYEPQGFLISGRPYLPDFRLPSLATWVEVKPGGADNFAGEHVDLCRGLAESGGDPVVLLTGLPDRRMYNRFAPGIGDDLQAVFFRDFSPSLVVADNYWFQRTEVRSEDGALMFAMDDRESCKAFGAGLSAAISAARSARFEHGERG